MQFYASVVCTPNSACPTSVHCWLHSWSLRSPGWNRPLGVVAIRGVLLRASVRQNLGLKLDLSSFQLNPGRSSLVHAECRYHTTSVLNTGQLSTNLVDHNSKMSEPIDNMISQGYANRKLITSFGQWRALGSLMTMLTNGTSICIDRPCASYSMGICPS